MLKLIRQIFTGIFLPVIIKEPLDSRNDLQKGGAESHDNTVFWLSYLSFEALVYELSPILGISMLGYLIYLPIVIEAISVISQNSSTPWYDVVFMPYIGTPLSNIISPFYSIFSLPEMSLSMEKVK